MSLPFPEPGPEIEPYAVSDPHPPCDPIEPKDLATRRPGIVALKKLLLTELGGGDLGISRDCAKGGPSDHWASNAFDWNLNANNPADVERAERFFDWLSAKDRFGNPDAMMRRLGITYAIWDHRVKSNKNSIPPEWRPYTGKSPHVDHVHLSLSPAGALGLTSFFTGKVLPGPSPVPPPPAVASTDLRPIAFVAGAAVGWIGYKRWLRAAR